jgi:NADH-quinone oxidoreductase subunit I
MFGLGVVKGLGITLKHFIATYVDDVKYFYFPSSATSQEAFARRQGPDGRGGIFTVEYPEMKLQTPENFRFLPFLITDYDVPADSPDYDRAQALEQDRCTSCGICAKVCPPQCIWIVRTDDPKTGKPIPQPEQFYIDTDICMNCGYCAEYCPFDAIKMDHDFELADYEREVGHIHDLDRLLKPISYYARIRPTWNAKEEAARLAAEAEKERKAAERTAARATPAAPQADVAPVVEATPAGESADAPPPAVKRSPEEVKAMREAMLAKKQQRVVGEEAAPAVNAEAAAAAEIRSAVVAPEAEAKVETAPSPAEAAAPDDLKVIEGIGPRIATLLQSAGITTFAQLAETEVSRLEQLLVEANLRRLADPAMWPEQARLAASGDWDAFNALTDQLKGGRRA